MRVTQKVELELGGVFRQVHRGSVGPVPPASETR
jgi:hypothetical protein